MTFGGSVSKGRSRDALWRRRCPATTISPGIMKPGGASGVRRWTLDIDCQSERRGEWRFYFLDVHERLRNHKGPISPRGGGGLPSQGFTNGVEPSATRAY